MATLIVQPHKISALATIKAPISFLKRIMMGIIAPYASLCYGVYAAQHPVYCAMVTVHTPTRAGTLEARVNCNVQCKDKLLEELVSYTTS